MSSIGTYEEFEAAWNRHQAAGTTGLDSERLGAELTKIRGRELLQTLEWLAHRHRDSRFREALAAINELDLVDEKGRWRPTRRGIGSIAEDGPAFLRDLVDKMRSEGCSQRQIFAYIASEQPEPAHSFAAAVKKVERLYRAAVGHRGTPEVQRRTRTAPQKSKHEADKPA